MLKEQKAQVFWDTRFISIRYLNLSTSSAGIHFGRYLSSHQLYLNVFMSVSQIRARNLTYSLITHTIKSICNKGSVFAHMSYQYP